MIDNAPSEATQVLFVDDDALTCKWFTRNFGNEFTILAANDADEALAVLSRHAGEIAVLVTDFRMPGRDGLALLQAVQRNHRSVVRLLVSAYAEKEVTIAAVNEGQVFRILEKPFDDTQVRAALRDAMALYREGARERALHLSRAAATRETLGFLAHELNTPLAIISGYMTALLERLQPSDAYGSPGVACISERRTGQVSTALDATMRSAMHCQSLISTFVQSARDAYSGTPSITVTASSLIKALLDEYPFETGEQLQIFSTVEHDFILPGRRDLLYLVVCTLTKNALNAVRGNFDAQLVITVGCTTQRENPRNWIKFEDNGSGIQPELLARLTNEPASTRECPEGSGMGLIFCRRVMQSIHGSMLITSQLGRGTTVVLHFQPFATTIPEEAST